MFPLKSVFLSCLAKTCWKPVQHFGVFNVRNSRYVCFVTRDQIGKMKTVILSDYTFCFKMSEWESVLVPKKSSFLVNAHSDAPKGAILDSWTEDPPPPPQIMDGAAQKPKRPIFPSGLWGWDCLAISMHLYVYIRPLALLSPLSCTLEIE